MHCSDIFGSGSGAISLGLLTLLLLLLGWPLHKTPKAPSFQTGSVYEIWHRLSESDFWYDVIRSRWRPWRSSAARCCICSSVRRLPASRRVRVTSLARCMCYCSLSMVHSYWSFGKQLI